MPSMPGEAIFVKWYTARLYLRMNVISAIINRLTNHAAKTVTWLSPFVLNNQRKDENMNNAGMSPKGYVNDLGEVMRKFGDKMCVAGNLNPYDDVEITSDEALSERIASQLSIGRKHGGRFITSTGSPMTPKTSVERLRRFIDLGHSS